MSARIAASGSGSSGAVGRERRPERARLDRRAGRRAARSSPGSPPSRRRPHARPPGSAPGPCRPGPIDLGLVAAWRTASGRGSRGCRLGRLVGHPRSLRRRGPCRRTRRAGRTREVRHLPQRPPRRRSWIAVPDASPAGGAAMLVATWHPIPCPAGVRMAFAAHLHGRDAEVTVARGRAHLALARGLARGPRPRRGRRPRPGRRGAGRRERGQRGPPADRSPDRRAGRLGSRACLRTPRVAARPPRSPDHGTRRSPRRPGRRGLVMPRLHALRLDGPRVLAFAGEVADAVALVLEVVRRSCRPSSSSRRSCRPRRARRRRTTRSSRSRRRCRARDRMGPWRSPLAKVRVVVALVATNEYCFACHIMLSRVFGNATLSNVTV